MPAVLTHKSIMLLARERLGQIRDVLSRKVRNGRAVTDLEHRLAYLASRAYEFMSESATDGPDLSLPPNPGGRRLGDGVSRFAVMGSMGPDIPAFSAVINPRQQWVFDTVHKGNPDHHRERVLAGTCDLVFAIWDETSEAINQSSRSAAAKEQERRKMRAYVLGHLCHIAGDVVSHPYVNDIEWHLTTAVTPKFSHAGGEGQIDAQVARDVLGRSGTREGQNWSTWWPEPDEVPREFYAAYQRAFDATYPPTAQANRVGFGAFEEEKRHGLQVASADFFEDGYRTFRKGVLRFAYDFGYWSWFGFLAPVLVPLTAALQLQPAMPRGANVGRTPEGTVDEGTYQERAWFEATMVVALGGAIAPVVYSIWLGCITTHENGEFIWMAIIWSILSLAACVIAVASVDVDDGDFPWWVRWLILFLVPAAQGLFYLIRFLVHCGLGDTRKAYACLIFMLGGVAVVLGLVLSILQCIDHGLAIGVAIVFGLVLLGLWIALPFVARDARIPESPGSFVAGQPHLVRLFDDASLVRAPGQRSQDLEHRIYPSSRRKLLRLWWTGPEKLYIRPQRTHIEFSYSGTGAPNLSVPSPADEVTARQFGERLERLVVAQNGSTGLRTELAYESDEAAGLESFLPPGGSFSDHGDKKDSVSEHNSAATEWRELGTSQGDSAYVLYHSIKSTQSVRYGRSGKASAETTEAEDGFTYVSNPLRPELVGGEALMDRAGDLGALLCMGATQRLLEVAQQSVPSLGGLNASGGGAVSPRLERVQHVFRNWSLDRRRVNEWRMLVHGGAAPEPGMGDVPTRPGAPLTATNVGAQVARQQGWVPLMRLWLNTAAERRQDMTDESGPEGASPRDLSRAMAYLFNMPDPVRVTPA